MEEFTIICDIKEKLPYSFENIKPKPKIITQHLVTGDYSILGMQHMIAIERKTLADCFGSVGKGRKRLEAEFQRMQSFDYAALILESSLSSIFTNPPSHSRMSSKAVFRTLISWSIKYHVHIWPCWSREAAEKVCYLILKRYYDMTTAKGIRND